MCVFYLTIAYTACIEQLRKENMREMREVVKMHQELRYGGDSFMCFQRVFVVFRVGLLGTPKVRFQ